jgi:hypothetical protein
LAKQSKIEFPKPDLRAEWLEQAATLLGEIWILTDSPAGESTAAFREVDTFISTSR